ncbi:MAG TPA: hypothetical protein VGC67_03700 [Cellulomonas sp.]
MTDVSLAAGPATHHRDLHVKQVAPGVHAVRIALVGWVALIDCGCPRDLDRVRASVRQAVGADALRHPTPGVLRWAFASLGRLLDEPLDARSDVSAARPRWLVPGHDEPVELRDLAQAVGLARHRARPHAAPPTGPSAPGARPVRSPGSLDPDRPDV